MKLNNKNNKAVNHSSNRYLQTRCTITAVFLSGIAMLCPGLSAETRPDPSGQVGKDLLQQNQRQKDKVVQEKKPVISEEALPQLEEDGGVEFLLKGIRFSRSAHLSRNELQALVKPLLGQTVTFNKLQQLVGQINQLYRQKNIYTSLAVLPEQKIEDGIVSIRLVEGSVGEVIFAGNEYTPDDYYRQWVHSQDHQDNIDVTELENDIQFYNRVHNQQLQAELRAGKAFGLTDIVITIPEAQRNAFSAFLDNYGYESTGETQLSGLYQRQHLFRAGDKGLAYALISRGIRSLSTSYSTVVGTDGWRLGGSLQYTDTDLNTGDFSTLKVKGSTMRYGLEASYLAYSDAEKWLTLLGAASSTGSENKVAGEELSDYQTRQYQAGVEGNWLGNRWQVTGRLLYSSVDSSEKVLGADRKITLYSPRATAIYNFDSPFYALTTVDAQLTSEKELPGAVSFSLGGPSTLRGYKPGIASGDKGWYQQLELHYNGYRYNEFLFDLYAFYDHGQIESPSAEQKMEAAGIGVNISGHKWLSLDFVAANALKEVVPDQDNTRIYARLTCNCWQ
ncbi:ShlB/FhaC/HecB family hemolysin secretion/activation protein [Endozoicomonas euniceicola]|uniref:POTRA domain-containing protein n=1 Tax=Endozoicomonas euniceicola TaxID=1234143 RepID=A0ABY6GRL8_9GAMM|nr:ShlB/FhaC/HecB family hemolysin secretion/activation protein [Endozoicomonas euniceicola]UYM14701.1 hypothetical protein NX720_17645 [Endozoicomonas euniceicola]